MISRLVFIIIACAALAVALALFCQYAFPDVVPYMPGEDTAAGWRREVAFLVTTLAFLAAEFSGLLSIVLAVRLWKKRTANVRAG